jgi:electron transport complex protein RnfA
MNSLPLALFVVFSSLSMNLILQCGLGMRGVAVHEKTRMKPFLIKLGILWSTVIVLWIGFSRIVTSLLPGFFGYILAFPLSALVFSGLEELAGRFILKGEGRAGDSLAFCDGLAAAALFMSLNIAGGFFEALVVSFGFTAGVFLACVIIREIRRRSALEAVPRFLRGGPLTLVSMGLLSLVFSSAALLFFSVLGG